MTTIAALMFGFTAGLIVMSALWRHKIAEKARNGFRLEAGGKLYSVREYCRVCYSEGWLWSYNPGVGTPCTACELGRSWPQGNQKP